MQLVTIADSKGGRPGLIVGERIFDLRVGHPSLELSRWRPDSVVGILDEGDAGLEHLQTLYDALAEDGDQPDLESAWLIGRGTRLGAPIRRPGLLLTVQFDATDRWVPLIKSPNALSEPGVEIGVPSHQGEPLNVRSQLVIVLGHRCHRASAEASKGCIGGFTLAFDIHHRSAAIEHDAAHLWERHLGGQQPGFFPLGPAITLGSDLAVDESLRLTVNGVAGEQWRPAQLPLSFAQIVATVSNYFSLRPGDVIAVGAPGAEGVVVRPGDALELHHPTLGRLTASLGP